MVPISSATNLIGRCNRSVDTGFNSGSATTRKSTRNRRIKWRHQQRSSGSCFRFPRCGPLNTCRPQHARSVAGDGSRERCAFLVVLLWIGMPSAMTRTVAHGRILRARTGGDAGVYRDSCDQIACAHRVISSPGAEQSRARATRAAPGNRIIGRAREALRL
jgi:hypothetical protein